MAAITLTTDFGAGSRYVAELKGVLYSRAPEATIVDLSHEIPPQDITTAARMLESAAAYWPSGTVHLAVVDPGVGTDRPIVLIEALGQRFLGPDNGLFGWLDGKADRVVCLDQSKLQTAGDSYTFHGRDLMAPAAARLAQGASITDLGEPTEGFFLLPSEKEAEAGEDCLVGSVREIDSYGNLITNLTPDALGDAPRDERLRVTLAEHETFGLWRTYGENPPQTLVALVGSGGQIELAIVNGSAAEMLAASVGDAVTLDWGEK